MRFLTPTRAYGSAYLLRITHVPTPLWARPCLHYDLIFIDAVSYDMNPDGRRANHSRKIMT